RIANESYLRTATERLSVLELARLIGYELRPGVAATTYLAFTVDDAAGAPPQTTIDAGVKVQSLPGPGETPQTFETVAKIVARVEWNALRPVQTESAAVTSDATEVWLTGTNWNLSRGDRILIVLGGNSLFSRLRRIEKVDVYVSSDRTRVTFDGSSVTVSNT